VGLFSVEMGCLYSPIYFRPLYRQSELLDFFSPGDEDRRPRPPVLQEKVDVDDKYALDMGIPFQVFSCWNGVTAFTGKMLYLLRSKHEILPELIGQHLYSLPRRRSGFEWHATTQGVKTAHRTKQANASSRRLTFGKLIWAALWSSLEHGKRAHA
jgi:hypothetical protein